MRSNRRLALAALLLLAFPGAGCIDLASDSFNTEAKDVPKPEGWVESEIFLCHDFDLLWETAKIQVVKNGYRIDDDATSNTRRRIVTAWKVDLAPSKGEGKRRRRFVEFREVKDAKDAWRVAVATVKQRNDDYDQPLNEAAAAWRSDPPDEEDARQVAYLIEARFSDYGPSKEFEYR